MNYDIAKKLILEQIERFNITELYAIPSRVGSITVETIDKYNFAEDKDIINAIKQTKAVLVQNMLTMWLQSDKPQLQIAAMKMLADDQARANLTGMETPNVGGGTTIDRNIIVQPITRREDVKEVKSNPPAITKQGRRKN
jgi:hypothetical protein